MSHDFMELEGQCALNAWRLVLFTSAFCVVLVVYITKLNTDFLEMFILPMQSATARASILYLPQPSRARPADEELQAQ